MKWGMKKGDEMKGCPSNSGRRLYHFAQTIEGCQTTADRTLSTLTLTKPLLTHGLRSQARSSARASSFVLSRDARDRKGINGNSYVKCDACDMLSTIGLHTNFQGLGGQTRRLWDAT